MNTKELLWTALAVIIAIVVYNKVLSKWIS